MQAMSREQNGIDGDLEKGKGEQRPRLGDFKSTKDGDETKE